MRPQNWPLLLSAYIERQRYIPFKWGTHDCCLFVADWVKELTGSDLATAFRSKYDSEFSADRLLAQHKGLEELVDWVFTTTGHNPIPPLSIRRGDVGTVQTDEFNGPSLGVCVGHRIALVGKTGLTFYPMTQTRRAWRID